MFGDDDARADGGLLDDQGNAGERGGADERGAAGERIDENHDEESGDSTTGSTFRGEGLVLGYPSTDDPVLDGLHLDVPPGQVTALVGPNGSGKSTLLKGLATQLEPDAGGVFLDGKDVYETDAKTLARELGMLSQENVSPDSITVEKLVAHGRYPHRGFFEPLTEADQCAIENAIGLAGVAHLREREVGSLSGGQKQLVWIAMALAQETDVLLLDEPTTFLDLHHQLEVMDVVETLRDDRDVTVVVVLHDVQQAARYADHLVALRDGDVRARGSPDEVVTQDLLADVFDVQARVTRGPAGPEVTPVRALHDGDGDSENRS
jgi:iron complex transport system ATP-binding protein